MNQNPLHSPLHSLKRALDIATSRFSRNDPMRMVTQDFTEAGRIRNVTAEQNGYGGYDVWVREGRQGGFTTTMTKSECLRVNAGLVRALIIMHEWVEDARRQSPESESKTPCFGSGPLYNHVAAAKKLRHYLR